MKKGYKINYPQLAATILTLLFMAGCIWVFASFGDERAQRAGTGNTVNVILDE